MDTRLDQLAAKFRRIGVASLRPAFYDDPAFLAAEADDPLLLDDYADYVRNLRFDDAYLGRARTVVRSAVRFLHRMQVEHRARGSCIDASVILGRFLERQGVWNYVAQGGVSLEFAAGTGLTPLYFAPVFDHHRVEPGRAATGHAWVVAPPYRIADATIAQQAYRRGEGRHVPGTVLAESVSPGGPRTIADWVDGDMLVRFGWDYGRAMELRDLPALIGPERIRLAERWDVVRVETPHVALKYCPTGTVAGDKPLEEAQNLVLCGLDPRGLYERWVREAGPF